jgi:superfamily I DNA and RNA helicase
MGQKLQNDRGYDLLGNLVFTEGDVLVESVYRFKGQAAPCVIFTEIDFKALDDLVLRKLFVGVTRAATKLTMILSERSAQMLIERLSDNDAIV